MKYSLIKENNIFYIVNNETGITLVLEGEYLKTFRFILDNFLSEMVGEMLYEKAYFEQNSKCGIVPLTPTLH